MSPIYTEIIIKFDSLIYRESIRSKGDDPSGESIIIMQIKRLVNMVYSEEALDLLKKFNVKGRYFEFFNEKIPNDIQQSIRLVLLINYIEGSPPKLPRVPFNKLESYIRTLDKGTARFDPEMSILMYGLYDSQAHEIIKRQFNNIVKEVAIQRGTLLNLIQSKLTQQNSDDMNTRIARGGAITSLRDMMRGDSNYPYNPDNKTLSAFQDPSQVNPKDTFLLEEERVAAESYFMVIQGLKHNQLMAALSQFGLNKLEERIKLLEEANKTSFFTFLLDSALPFALGKYLKYLGSKPPSNIKDNIAATIRELKEIEVDYEIVGQNVVSTIQAQAIIKNLKPLNSFMEHIKGDIDDYTIFAKDAFNQIKKGINVNKTRIDSFEKFVKHSIEENERAINFSLSNLQNLSDASLLVEISLSSKIGYSYYYDEIKKKFQEIEEKRQKEHQERLLKFQKELNTFYKKHPEQERHAWRY